MHSSRKFEGEIKTIQFLQNCLCLKANLELCIDNLRSQIISKTGDLDLDLQGQICHKSSNVCVTPPCECDNF